MPGSLIHRAKAEAQAHRDKVAKAEADAWFSRNCVLATAHREALWAAHRLLGVELTEREHDIQIFEGRKNINSHATTGTVYCGIKVDGVAFRCDLSNKSYGYKWAIFQLAKTTPQVGTVARWLNVHSLREVGEAALDGRLQMPTDHQWRSP